MVGIVQGFIILGMVGQAWAPDYNVSRDTLKGIEGIAVLIEHLRPEVEQAGLTRKQLHIDVELRLRQFRVPVISEEKHNPSLPLLYVNVNVAWNSFGVYVFNIDLSVVQMGRLVSTDTLAYVSTWSTTGAGLIEPSGLIRIRTYLRDYVDRFINAYLSVNPPTTPAVSPPIPLPGSPSLHRDLVRQVQARLQATGFPPGAIDGMMGPQTRDALRWFQNTKGLVPTGELDEKTLDALSIR
jgi:hypothetical protein